MFLSRLLGSRVVSSDQVEGAAKAGSEEASLLTGIGVASTNLSQDHAEWVRYLAQAHRAFRKPGISVRTEYDLWLTARSRGRVS